MPDTTIPPDSMEAVAFLADLPLARVLRGELKDGEWERLHKAAKELQK